MKWWNDSSFCNQVRFISFSILLPSSHCTWNLWCYQALSILTWDIIRKGKWSEKAVRKPAAYLGSVALFMLSASKKGNLKNHQSESISDQLPSTFCWCSVKYLCLLKSQEILSIYVLKGQWCLPPQTPSPLSSFQQSSNNTGICSCLLKDRMQRFILKHEEIQNLGYNTIVLAAMSIITHVKRRILEEARQSYLPLSNRMSLAGFPRYSVNHLVASGPSNKPGPDHSQTVTWSIFFSGADGTSGTLSCCIPGASKPGIHPSTQTSHKKFHCWTFKGKEGKCTLWRLHGFWGLECTDHILGAWTFTSDDDLSLFTASVPVLSSEQHWENFTKLEKNTLEVYTRVC